MIVLTYLGPKSVKLIFYAPNVANLGFWRIENEMESFNRNNQLEHSTDNCIKVLTIAL